MGRKLRLEQSINQLLANQDIINSQLSEIKKALPNDIGLPGTAYSMNMKSALGIIAAIDSARFVEEFLHFAKIYDSRDSQLISCLEIAPKTGPILEFGVGNGSSLRVLSEHSRSRQVFGFDSFDGLPMDWRAGFPKGTFSQIDAPKIVDAQLVVGLFEETLGPFIERLDSDIALIHIDCDLYESTVTVLQGLRHFIGPTTIIVCDEYFNYPGWTSGEFKAVNEFAETHSLRIEYIGYVANHEEASFRFVQ